ncbi:MAG TPA: hypothetical protein VKB81_11685 [Nitrospira sp.]|nr:hypothetical protein [Nitrospira sp.]
MSRYRHGDDPPCAPGAHPDRRPPIQSLPLRRLLILAWLIAWMSTVPLFHIHLPDTTDRWSVLQSGGAHTVLTPDLPGEYAPPSHASHRDSSALTSRGVNSPELGIVLFGEKAKKSKALTVLGSLSRVRTSPLLLRVAHAFAASRAPPRSACA